jgi:hypothetical protein
MTLNFSEKPGPRERHLQRRLNNPLFINTSDISQAVINAASQLDEFSAQQFMMQFRELVERVVSLDSSVEGDEILLLKAKLEHEYAVCTGLYGQPAGIQDAIKKLINAMSAALRNASKNDPDALEKLRTDETHTMLHLQLCDHLIVSDMLGPDEVIPDNEYLPALLSEPANVLEAVLLLFPPERIRTLADEGQVLLEKLEAAGHDLPEARLRLAQMQSLIA